MLDVFLTAIALAGVANRVEKFLKTHSAKTNGIVIKISMLVFIVVFLIILRTILRNKMSFN